MPLYPVSWLCITIPIIRNTCDFNKSRYPIRTEFQISHLVSGGEPAPVGRPGEGEDVLAVRAALVARRLRVDVPEPDSVVARAGGLQGGGSSTERADIMELIAYSSDGVCI